LPWCAGVPVRRACRTGTVPLALAVELIEGQFTAQGVNGSPAGTPGCRRARRPGSGMAGLPTGRPDARERRGIAGRCGPGPPGYRTGAAARCVAPVVPSR